METRSRTKNPLRTHDVRTNIIDGYKFGEDFNKNKLKNKSLLRLSVYLWGIYMHLTHNPRKYKYVLMNMHTSGRENNINLRRFDRFAEDGIGVYTNKSNNKILNNNALITHKDFEKDLQSFILNTSIDNIIIPCTYYYNKYGELNNNGEVITNSHFFCLIIKKKRGLLKISIFEPFTHLKTFKSLNKGVLNIFKNKFLNVDYLKGIKIVTEKYNIYINDPSKSPSVKIGCDSVKNFLNSNNIKFRDNGYCEIFTKIFMHQFIKHGYVDFYNDYMTNELIKYVLMYIVYYDIYINGIINNNKFLKRLKYMVNKTHIAMISY